MDDSDEREAFLNAIYDAPADDLPRLVFADWLDERGEFEWAELIRLQCQRPASPQSFLRERDLLNRVYADKHAEPGTIFERGFRLQLRLVIVADQLSNAEAFRQHALRNHPEWYGATELKLSGGLIQSGKPILTILTGPVTARIAHLDFSGSILTSFAPRDEFDTSTFALMNEYEYRPVVTVQAVESLVNAREARRLTHLDLRNNDLDNDAARAIVNSKNLIRIQSLQLFDGNQLRGRTWQHLLERFGPDVVQ